LLVATRLAVRRRPVDVIRPKPFTPVALLEPDPDDRSLIDETFVVVGRRSCETKKARRPCWQGRAG